MIMTSNIGARQLKDFGQGVGFTTSAKVEQAETHSRSVIENALKRAFAPEFLNRVDDVIVFNSLDKEHIFKIIDIELRSEEHTSELQSLMRISYAVFCLKKKKQT